MPGQQFFEGVLAGRLGRDPDVDQVSIDGHVRRVRLIGSQALAGAQLASGKERGSRRIGGLGGSRLVGVRLAGGEPLAVPLRIRSRTFWGHAVEPCLVAAASGERAGGRSAGGDLAGVPAPRPAPSPN